MPCHAAMIEKMMTLSPDEEVEGVLKRMKKSKAEAAVVIDEDEQVVGLFTLRELLKTLLPVSVAMSDGIQLDVRMNAAPGIAKRLKKSLPLKVSDLMERKFVVVHPETPLWEGVNMLTQHGSPLLVVDSQSEKAVGLISYQSALDELNRLKDSES